MVKPVLAEILIFIIDQRLASYRATRSIVSRKDVAKMTQVASDAGVWTLLKKMNLPFGLPFCTFQLFDCIQHEAFPLFNFSTFRNRKWNPSTFRLFDFLKFNMKPSTFRLFDFSKLKMKPVHFSTFRFFEIQNEFFPLFDFSKFILRTFRLKPCSAFFHPRNISVSKIIWKQTYTKIVAFSGKRESGLDHANILWFRWFGRVHCFSTNDWHMKSPRRTLQSLSKPGLPGQSKDVLSKSVTKGCAPAFVLVGFGITDTYWHETQEPF